MSEIAWIELGSPWRGVTAVRVSDDAPAAAAGLVVVDAGLALARLHPDERSAGAALPIARRRDWAAGRLALRAAIERAGGELDVAIGADDRGAPRLPAGWIGSISHKRGLAIALADVADAAGDWRIGVDVELDAPSRIGAAIEGRVLTSGERATVAAIDDADARGRAVMLRFAIKEAIYKAVDPWVRRYVGFQEVELELLEGDGGGVRIASELGCAIEARWVRWHDCVIAVTRARRS